MSGATGSGPFSIPLDSLFDGVTVASICVPFFTAVIILITVWVTDYWIARRTTTPYKVHYDPVGFSLNELHLLNRASVEGGVMRRNVRINAKGSVRLMTAASMERCDESSLTFPTSSEEFDLRVAKIDEYVDLTNLLVTNGQQNASGNPKGSEKDSIEEPSQDPLESIKRSQRSIMSPTSKKEARKHLTHKLHEIQ